MKKRVDVVTFMMVLVVIGLLSLSVVYKPAVAIDIENKSGVELSNLVISTKNTAVKLNSLENNTSKRVFLNLDGEGSFFIEAMLPSGQLIQGHGLYIEPGYTIQTRVLIDSVESEYTAFF